MVDGVEHARIDLDMTRGARFSLDKDAELIEVRSHDNAGEELLLASHLLTPSETENRVQPVDASIILEGGQRIAIHVSQELSDTNTIVEIMYRETNPFRAASLLLTQLAQSSSGASQSLWKDRRVFGAAIIVVFVISFAVVMKYIRGERSDATEPNQIAATQQKGETKDETHPTKAVPDSGVTSTPGETSLKSSNPPQQGFDTRQQRQNVGPSQKIETTARNSGQEKPDIASEPGTVTETETRSITAVGATPLSAVKKVYVEAVGDETLSQNVRQTLAERLRASNQIILAHNRDEADALLKVTVVKSPSGEPAQTKSLVELINARGNVIWSNPSDNYRGSPADVSANIVRDLLAAIKNSKQRK